MSMVIAKNNAKEGEIQKPSVLNTTECKTIARARGQLWKKWPTVWCSHDSEAPQGTEESVLGWVFHDLISSIRPSREPRLVSYLPSPPRVLTVFSTLNSFLSLLHTDHFPSLHETGLDATLPSVLSLFSNPAIFILLLSLAFNLKYNCISLYCFYSVNFNTSKRF